MKYYIFLFLVINCIFLKILMYTDIDVLITLKLYLFLNNDTKY